MNSLKPEINELQRLVEEKYGKPLRTSTDFDEISFFIRDDRGVAISASTLKRLWGYVNDTHNPRNQTLDALSRYIGHDHFKAFCLWLKSTSAYSSSFFSTHQLMSKELKEGQQVEIGWAPNRHLLLVHQGNGLFEVLKAKASKLQPGDRFEAQCFMKGYPLFLPYVLRQEEKTSPFIAGRNGGLTLINLLNEPINRLK